MTHFYKGKKVLVTGGTGLIGRAIVKKLLEFGAEVTIASLDDLNLFPGVRFKKVDLTCFDDTVEVMRDVDCVVHAAGIKGSIEVTLSRPASFFVPMARFNLNVLEAARLNAISNLVYMSSIGAYSSAEIFVEDVNDEGPPMDRFPGWAKRMAELQIEAYRKEYSLDWSIVRPCNVYGPGDNFDPDNAMVIPSLMMKVERGDDPVLVWGDGSAIRDFAYSDDIAEGTLLALQHGTRGSYVNLGSGEGYAISELVDSLSKIVNFNYEFDSTKSGGFPRRIMNINRAREWLGYDPKIDLRTGLELTWNWFQENKDEYLRRHNYFR
ncbi:NAD-dependent epimerase/dehydratase family protein [Litoricolaceae bacterium]|nr:NAD-dependent epimerase/dehydratase family protein [Litorivicinaceae bacterium]